jgi:hypothetical protein
MELLVGQAFQISCIIIGLMAALVTKSVAEDYRTLKPYKTKYFDVATIVIVFLSFVPIAFNLSLH